MPSTFSHRLSAEEKLEKYTETTDYLVKHLGSFQNIQLAIVCGSGLGGIVSIVKPFKEFDYSVIPHFVTSTVEGHKGKLVFGKLNDVNVVCMVGRFHFYEGHSPDQITFPFRVFSLLGINNVLLTNASGGLNPNYKVGDLMIINDHINLVGMAGLNPLIGPNEARFGERFPAMNDVYDKELIKKLRISIEQAGIDQEFVHEGVYVYIAGPSYETKAEARYLRTIGADAVGMSTVPEAIICKHSGMKVVAVALITNMVIQCETDFINAPCHAEVLEASKVRALELESMVKHFVKIL